MHFQDPGRIKVFLKDAQKKNVLRIFKEVVMLWTTKKEVPLYYFKHLYKNGIDNYRDYLSPGEVRRIHGSPNLHKSEYTSILHNKLNFALYCQRNAIRTPTLVGHNFESSFFADKERWQITETGDLATYFERLFASSGPESIFIRPLSLNGGQGCLRLDRATYKEALARTGRDLFSGDHIFTETLLQHNAIDAIYARSINTLRILTYFDGEKAEILSSFIRIGAGGSIVDNGSSGGLFVGIDDCTGTLKRTGYRDMKFGGGEFTEHPDTGFVFEGFQIPLFREACELVLKAARHIPNGFIGWDVAITPEGPTLIEGNEDPHLFMSDVAYGGLLANPGMQKVMAAVTAP